MARRASGERDGHSSGTPVTRRLKQPTRAAGPDGPETEVSHRSYSVLLPVGFTVPFPLPETRCALAAPFHPCRRLIRNAPVAVCFSVALSLSRSAACAETNPPDVI